MTYRPPTGSPGVTGSCAVDRYRHALAAIPAPGYGRGCHPYLLTVANHGVMAGLRDDQLFRDIRASIPPGRRRVPDSDIRTTIGRARRDQRHPRRCTQPSRPAPRPFDGAAYRQRLIDRANGAGEPDLWDFSPVRFDWPPGTRDAVTLLTALYQPHEVLYIGDTYGRQVATVDAWLHWLQDQPHAPWPHIMPNPVDGQTHETKNGKISLRCDAAICTFRFVLVEFDDLPREDQEAFWFTVIWDKLMPVAALIDSGGKSIHAWLRVDLPDRDSWDKLVRHELYGDQGRLTRLGADRACCNPARLSRLPGHFRQDKAGAPGRWQRLLYLAPDA